MRYFIGRLLIAASAVLMPPPLYAQGNPDQGAKLASQGDGSGAPCFACHGADGNGNNAAGFPRLAGLSASYLAKQMLDYKHGVRENRDMKKAMRRLSRSASSSRTRAAGSSVCSSGRLRSCAVRCNCCSRSAR